MSQVMVGPLASACAAFSLVSLLSPALHTAPHGGQQAGLRGVVGQRLHHTGTHSQGQRQGTLWSEGVGAATSASSASAPNCFPHTANRIGSRLNPSAAPSFTCPPLLGDFDATVSSRGGQIIS